MVIWLTDLIDMFGQSISIIAFNTELVITIYTIILYCVLYIVHDKRMERSFLRRQFSTAPRQK